MTSDVGRTAAAALIPIEIPNLHGEVITYGEQSAPILIDQGIAATLATALPSFAGIVLNISIDGMSFSQLISVTDEGSGPGQIGFQDGTIFYEGQEIGQAVGGDGSPLSIAFTGGGTEAVEALLRNLTYEDFSDAPAGGVLVISLTGDSGVLERAAVSLNVIQVDDLPQAEADSFALNAGELLAGDLCENDFDPDAPTDRSLFHISSVIGASGTASAIANDGTSVTIAGAYGSLVIYASGAFTYAANNDGSIPANGTVTDAFLYTIVDGHGSSNSAGFTFDVTAPAVIEFADFDSELTYLEQSAPLQLGMAAIVNGGVPSFSGITLTVSLADTRGSELLSVIAQGDAPGEINISDDGVVSFGGVAIGSVTAGLGEPLSVFFNGSASVESLTELLHSIAYEDLSDAPVNKEITISLSNASSILATTSVTLIAEQEGDDPVSGDDYGTVAVAGSCTGNVTVNDVDPDGSGSEFTVSGFYAGSVPPPSQAEPGASVQGAFGTFTLNDDGSFVYVADNAAAIPAGGTEIDVFTYSVTSSNGGESSARIEIAVENPLQVSLFAFANFDGDDLTYQEQSGLVLIDHDASVSSNGLGWNGVKLSVTLNNATSAESIALAIGDASAGGIGISGANVSYLGTTIGTIAQLSSSSFKLNLLATATDAAVSAILISIQYSNPLEVLVAQSRVISISASLGGQVFGADSAVFQVNPVNDPLLAQNDPNTAVEDLSVSGNVLANDVDPDRPPLLASDLTIWGAANGSAPPVHSASGPLLLAGNFGTLILNQNGSFTYRAEKADDLIAGETAIDIFTYATRNAAGEEATARLSIAVAGADEIRTGGAANDVLTGGRGSDTLTGGAGRDWLDGGAGADFMYGGIGDDTFIVDNFNDQIFDTKGTDTVQAKTGFSLRKGLSIEIMKAASTNVAGVTLSGNELRQKISGNLGNDLLNGKGGDDTLSGGKGKDTFVFDSRKGSIDALLDFRSGHDKIHLSGSVFGLKKGALKSGAFAKIHGPPKSPQSDDRVLYDRSKGFLYVDWDGAGSKTPALVAILKSKPSLLAKDFFVI